MNYIIYGIVVNFNKSATIYRTIWIKNANNKKFVVREYNSGVNKITSEEMILTNEEEDFILRNYKEFPQEF
jgi:hypothetical protein